MIIYVAIIAVMFVCYNASAISGLRAGITWLSNRNVQLFLVESLLVLMLGNQATSHVQPTVVNASIDIQNFGNTRSCAVRQNQLTSMEENSLP